MKSLSRFMGTMAASATAPAVSAFKPGKLHCLSPKKGVEHKATVIFLHGLGDSGEPWFCDEFFQGPMHDKLPFVKWIFPTAPERSVTCNGGMVSTAWYDIESLGSRELNSYGGKDESANYIHDLIRTEIVEHSIDRRNVVLAGFSQGAAMSVYSTLTAALPTADISDEKSGEAAAERSTADAKKSESSAASATTAASKKKTMEDSSFSWYMPGAALTMSGYCLDFEMHKREGMRKAIADSGLSLCLLHSKFDQMVKCENGELLRDYCLDPENGLGMDSSKVSWKVTEISPSWMNNGAHTVDFNEKMWALKFLTKHFTESAVILK